VAIGKTTVSVSVAHAKISEFGGAIHFVDLGAIDDPSLVPRRDCVDRWIFRSIPIVRCKIFCLFVRDRRMLLVLDNCEHLIETAAPVGRENFQRSTPSIHSGNEP